MIQARLWKITFSGIKAFPIRLSMWLLQEPSSVGYRCCPTFKTGSFSGFVYFEVKLQKQKIKTTNENETESHRLIYKWNPSRRTRQNGLVQRWSGTVWCLTVEKSRQIVWAIWCLWRNYQSIVYCYVRFWKKLSSTHFNCGLWNENDSVWIEDHKCFDQFRPTTAHCQNSIASKLKGFRTDFS